MNYNITAEGMNKVHFLQSMKICKGDENDNLLKLSVKGISQEESVGLPVLRMRSQIEGRLKNGILEFDFLVKPIEHIKKKSVEFNLDIVFNRNQLPSPFVGVKIIAEKNADIMLI